MPEVNHIPGAGKIVCPVCGNPLQMDQWKWPECTKCPFQCALSDLPRISAAMEVSKLRAKYYYECDNMSGDEQQELWDMISDANKRALEAFK